MAPSIQNPSIREDLVNGHHVENHLQQLQNRRHRRKKFVLCFDGTGNKFSGTDSDSNILKIYRCLDRSADDQFHYYQPGIGTYVSSKSLSHTGRIARLKSWYMKAKDSAIGTSFAEHVMGGYKFLMRYYSPGDDIFLFGFSRGAYTARFLAEMLDHVGLLSAGNEEMARFAWKTFQKWQTRRERTAEEKEEKRQLLEYMCAFRETFSRPVHRIRFLGLFDTVNSVPHFENAWMQRSRFPYTARSTAKVIRHAVAIDERRAKFRQDLISEVKEHRGLEHGLGLGHGHHHYRHSKHHTKKSLEEINEEKEEAERGRQPGAAAAKGLFPPPTPFRNQSETSGVRSRSRGSPHSHCREVSPSVSQTSLPPAVQIVDGDEMSDGEGGQDIREVWFAGCHADIGGGWALNEGEEASLSHVPLVWMIREAQQAGLQFDITKLQNLNCCADEDEEEAFRHLEEKENDEDFHSATADIPRISIDAASPSPQDNYFPSPPRVDSSKVTEPASTPPVAIDEKKKPKQERKKKLASPFHDMLFRAATAGHIHDVLQFNNGVPHTSVVSWNIMEYLPFRRMDLQPDGSWKSISWPLPKGEVRDMPDNAIIHSSVIKRMEADPNYRPGNLICGGGGRGVRKAPKEKGMGKWKVLREEGHPIGECLVRAEPPEKK